MTEPEAIRIGLRLLAAIAVMVGVFFAIIGAGATWKIYRMHRER